MALAISSLDVALDEAIRTSTHALKRAVLQPMEDSLQAYMPAFFDAQGRELVKRLRKHPTLIVDNDWEKILAQVMEQSRGDLFALLDRCLSDSYRAGVRAAKMMVGNLREAALPHETPHVLDMGLTFSGNNLRAQKKLKEMQAKLVTNLDATTRKAVGEMIALGRQQGWSYDKLAKSLRIQFRDNFVGKPGEIPQWPVGRWPQRYIRDRAVAVAVTETGNAYEMGAYDSIAEGQQAGLEYEKSWLATPGACGRICGPNAGLEWIPLDQPYPRGMLHPLGHPVCRCTELYRRKGADYLTGTGTGASVLSDAEAAEKAAAEQTISDFFNHEGQFNALSLSNLAKKTLVMEILQAKLAQVIAKAPGLPQDVVVHGTIEDAGNPELFSKGTTFKTKHPFDVHDTTIREGQLPLPMHGLRTKITVPRGTKAAQHPSGKLILPAETVYETKAIQGDLLELIARAPKQPVIGRFPTAEEFGRMTKIEGPHGANPSQWYRDSNGQEWFVKETKDRPHAECEVAANLVYREAGAAVPEIGLVTVEGKLCIVSKKLENIWPIDTPSGAMRDQVRKYFGLDALLSNWDVVGAGGTANLFWDAVGDRLVRIETGGAMAYGGLGAHKPGWDLHSEWRDFDTMRDSNYNVTCARVFGDITSEELIDILTETKQMVDIKHLRQVWSDAGIVFSSVNYNPDVWMAVIEHRLNQIDDVIVKLRQRIVDEGDIYGFRAEHVRTHYDNLPAKKKLTAAEHRVLENWRGSSGDITEAADLALYEAFKKFGKVTENYVREKIQTIDGLMDRFHNTETIIVERGTEFYGREAEWRNLKPGDVFTDIAYGASGIDYHFSGRLQLRLTLPPGTRCIPEFGLHPLGRENEIIYDRNLIFVVDKVEAIGSELIVHAHVDLSAKLTPAGEIISMSKPKYESWKTKNLAKQQAEMQASGQSAAYPKDYQPGITTPNVWIYQKSHDWEKNTGMAYSSWEIEDFKGMAKEEQETLIKAWKAENPHEDTDFMYWWQENNEPGSYSSLAKFLKSHDLQADGTAPPITTAPEPTIDLTPIDVGHVPEPTPMRVEPFINLQLGDEVMDFHGSTYVVTKISPGMGLTKVIGPGGELYISTTSWSEEGWQLAKPKPVGPGETRLPEYHEVFFNSKLEVGDILKATANSGKVLNYTVSQVGKHLNEPAIWIKDNEGHEIGPIPLNLFETDAYTHWQFAKGTAQTISDATIEPIKITYAKKFAETLSTDEVIYQWDMLDDYLKEQIQQGWVDAGSSGSVIGWWKKEGLPGANLANAPTYSEWDQWHTIQKAKVEIGAESPLMQGATQATKDLWNQVTPKNQDDLFKTWGDVYKGLYDFPEWFEAMGHPGTGLAPNVNDILGLSLDETANIMLGMKNAKKIYFNQITSLVAKIPSGELKLVDTLFTALKPHYDNGVAMSFFDWWRSEGFPGAGPGFVSITAFKTKWYSLLKSEGAI